MGWTSDVRSVLGMCLECTRYKRGKLPKRTPLCPIKTGDIWEMVSIDITGPHRTSRDGYNFILTLQDHNSKWTEAFPHREICNRLLCLSIYTLQATLSIYTAACYWDHRR